MGVHQNGNNMSVLNDPPWFSKSAVLDIVGLDQRRANCLTGGSLRALQWARRVAEQQQRDGALWSWGGGDWTG